MKCACQKYKVGQRMWRGAYFDERKDYTIGTCIFCERMYKLDPITHVIIKPCKKKETQA